MSNITNMLLAMAVAAVPASAQAAYFTFEGAFASGVSASGYTSYSETNAGTTMTLTRSALAFDVVDNSGGQSGKPAGWGLRSLSPFANFGSTILFVADFSSAQSALSIEFGDYGADSPDTADLFLWSGLGGTGTLVGSASATFSAGTFPAFATVSATGRSSFRSATFIGGTPSFPTSVFFDNFNATGAVPEPASWAMMISGFGLVGGALRARRFKPAVASA